jgi:hypothetical protein
VITGELISGKYRLLRPLGSGGMGSVWAARNELTDRDFAVKFLLPSLATNTEALHRFFHEARACGQIKHPAVVDVYDMGQAEDGSPFLVMELLEGEGLDHRLARGGPFRPGEAAMTIAFIARGLEEAHVRGLVHRDIKPANIFFAIDERGEIVPKLLDFGISKATGPTQSAFRQTVSGAVVGSPAYMSPEQARGDLDTDGRSDVWSLGIILYEILTGRVPFDAPNYNALMLSIMTKPHTPVRELAPTVPPELEAVIDQALQKDRANRMGTARELAERLESVAVRLSESPVGIARVDGRLLRSGAPGPWARTGGPRPGRSTAFLVAGGLALAGVLGAIAVVRLRPPLAAVAGRSLIAVNASLSRTRRLLVELEASEALAKAPAPSATAPVATAPPPTPTPSGEPSAKPKTPGGKTGPKPPKSDDPHGGVDGPGF